MRRLPLISVENQPIFEIEKYNEQQNSQSIPDHIKGGHTIHSFIYKIFSSLLLDGLHTSQTLLTHLEEFHSVVILLRKSMEKLLEYEQDYL